MCIRDRVVPVISVGDGSRAGAAQVSGPQSKVDQVKAALMIEQTLLGVRCKVLIPVDNVSYQNVNRLPVSYTHLDVYKRQVLSLYLFLLNL